MYNDNLLAVEQELLIFINLSARYSKLIISLNKLIISLTNMADIATMPSKHTAYMCAKFQHSTFVRKQDPDVKSSILEVKIHFQAVAKLNSIMKYRIIA